MSPAATTAPRASTPRCAVGVAGRPQTGGQLMRCAGIAGRSPGRWKTTTIPDPAASTRADLIRRDFADGSRHSPCRTDP